MKKKNSIVRSLSLLAGLLAGAALALSAQTRIGLGGGSHGVSFAAGATSAKTSVGTCNGPTCSTGGIGAIATSQGSSFGMWNPSGASAGAFTFQSGIGTTSSISGSFALTLADQTSHPQFNVAAADGSETDHTSPLLSQDNGSNLGYMLNQLLCSSSTSGSCALQNMSGNVNSMGWDHGKHKKLTVAPEPAAAFLLGTGLLGIALLRRRKLIQPEM